MEDIEEHKNYFEKCNMNNIFALFIINLNKINKHYE